MYAFEFAAVVFNSILIAAVFRPGRKKTAAREPKMWHIPLAAAIIFFLIAFLTGGFTLAILLCLIFSVIAASGAWFRERNRKQKEKMPWFTEICEAIENSKHYNNKGIIALAILHEFISSTTNITIAKQLLQENRDNEIYDIKPDLTNPFSRSVLLVSFTSGDNKTYLALLHESETGLLMETAGIWERV